MPTDMACAYVFWFSFYPSYLLVIDHSPAVMYNNLLLDLTNLQKNLFYLSSPKLLLNLFYIYVKLFIVQKEIIDIFILLSASSA